MAEKKKEKLHNLIMYAGVTEDEYQNILPSIYKKNLRMLTTSSLVSTLFFFGLFLVSFFIDAIASNHLLYAIMVPCSGSVLIVSLTVLRTRDLPVVLYCSWYLFLIFIYGYAIILGTFMSTGNLATTFPVLLFATPLFLLDRPYRIICTMTIFSIIFGICSVCTKPSNYAVLDLVNIVCFLLLSIIINIQLIHTKVRDILVRRFIETDRDTDDLTKLLTKSAAERKISRYMQTSAQPATLIIMDIDDFKEINDTYGHAFGDTVLRLIGNCIHKVFRQSDILGRFGGDEFIIFLPNTDNQEIAGKKAAQLLAQLQTEIVFPSEFSSIQGSIGIATYPAHGTTYSELFRSADAALYLAKRHGKNQYAFYQSIRDRK